MKSPLKYLSCILTFIINHLNIFCILIDYIFKVNSFSYIQKLIKFFQHLKRYFYIYHLIFIELTPKKKYSKQNLPHTQRPTILTHLLKQTRQTTTTQPNNIITLPILILKNHRNTINKLRKTILITQNPIHQR